MNIALILNIEEKLNISSHGLFRLRDFFVTLMIATLVICPDFASAQVPPQAGANMEREHQNEMPSKTLSEQIGELSRQVSELQAKVKEQGVDAVAMKANGDHLRLKMSMGTMGGVAQTSPPQAIAPTGNNQGSDAGMMAGMMSMMNSMMGGMGGMSGGAPMGKAVVMGANSIVSELPGFPGSSHLYHIGATNFFLDHPQHITLSLEQQSRLGEIRTKALLSRSEFNRKIQEDEEQLWLLTASDQPNFLSIEAKVRESEKLQGDFRLAFIKDVGEAANVLTSAQQMALLGKNVLPPAVVSPPNAAMGGM